MLTNLQRNVSYVAPVNDHYELALELNFICSESRYGTGREHLRQLLALLDKPALNELANLSVQELAGRVSNLDRVAAQLQHLTD